MSEIVYTGGWEIDLHNHEELIFFVKQHRISRKDFELFTTIQSGLEFHFEGNYIHRVVEQSLNELIAENIKIECPSFEINPLFWLKKDNTGNHILGGKMPREISIMCPDDYQPVYLGALDASDNHFKWMGMERFHLFYPLNFYYEMTFIDYSDEDNLKVLSNSGLKKYRPKLYLDELKYSATTSVSMEELENEQEPVHQCGVPLWYQYPQYPLCPVSGELMKFVCSISSTRETRLKKKGIFTDKQLDDCLSFGDFGNLFVFFTERTKIACYFIQF
jgi:hypothetical protein